MDEVIRALEAFFANNPAVQWPSKASLWDLFKLEPDNGGQGKYSDRGSVLSRLDAKVLKHLRKWLEENAEEAISRYGSNRHHGLWATVCISASLLALPQDEPLLPEQHDESLPLQVAGFKSSGRSKDLTKVIHLKRLRATPRFFSGRDLAKTLEIPRTTLKHMIRRMDEINFSLDSFNGDDLAYIAFGKPRGCKRESEPR